MLYLLFFNSEVGSYCLGNNVDIRFSNEAVRRFTCQKLYYMFSDLYVYSSFIRNSCDIKRLKTFRYIGREIVGDCRTNALKS